MNRYSLIFALLVASSFAVHPNQVGKDSVAEGQSSGKHTGNGNKGTKTQPKPGGVKPTLDEPVRFLKSFLEKAAPVPQGHTSEGRQGLKVLFATVPHPIETNLGSAFDHNVEALQDGLQESGYLFDSSWIPWSAHEPRDNFEDDEKERESRAQEDDFPGILLFRRNDANSVNGAYSNGVVVFLLSEKPTQGIATIQAQTAWRILQQKPLQSLIREKRIQTSGPIRVLGPTFSGSLPSLNAIIKILHGKCLDSKILVRSGGVTGGLVAVASFRELARELPLAFIDFGSAHHDYSDWDRLAESTLGRMGIGSDQIAFLSEDESSYGSYTRALLDQYHHSAWRLSFPRDISILRAGYSQQGLFDFTSPSQPWKRYLNLKSDLQNGGDTIRSFGGATTTETQEAILFGISEFMKSHGIRAVVIAATNEEDRLFLTQFLHANNPGVRVVVIGNSRIFMRGSTAQFSGDLMVDDFPMLPRLHDWTAAKGDVAPHLFADDISQGIFFAAIDLLGEVQNSGQFNWYPEYSSPNWNGTAHPVQRPPMFVVALGSNSTWPVAEGAESQFLQDDPDPFLVEMPFTLFEHDWPTESERAATPSVPQIHVGRHWKVLAAFVVFLVFLYCVAIWYANPISRDQFASFQPSVGWEFWLLKIMLPAGVAGGAFWVMAWAVAIPGTVSPDAVRWWYAAEAATLLAPLGILGSAVCKARWKLGMDWDRWMLTSALLTVSIAFALCYLGDFFAGPGTRDNVSSILNTYREAHWESGLSLVPTWLFFLMAILVWASQAANGAAALRGAPPLPSLPDTNLRISEEGAELILQVGRPIPNPYKVKWLWIAWGVPAVTLLFAHFFFGPFKEITTLESEWTTVLTRGVAAALVAMVLFDIFQFLWLWDQLQGLLHALGRVSFKRSFVTIRDFDWRSLWSFRGVSFQSRRTINSELIDSLLKISSLPGFDRLRWATIKLKDIRDYYNTCDLSEVKREDYLKDKEILFGILSWAGDWLATYIEDPNNRAEPVKVSVDAEALQRVLECQCKGEGGRWSDEVEELARLPEFRQVVERFLCLMYIGFIQTVVARLHTLLISVASMYSLLALGIALYPFVPVTPLLIMGGALLILIAWAFFKVFSQMDTDPILSRIVNGDDRKLESSFYVKFAEAMALPLLTAGSALLPGGAGRLLELAQALFSHST